MSVYHRPETLSAAFDLLHDQPTLRIVAGATDVYPAQTSRAGWGDMRRPDVLDISSLVFARGVAKTADGWSLSPHTTWTDVIEAHVPPVFDGLKAAARQVGGAQVQNRGTVIGNICNASPAADGVPPLLALDAVVEIASLSGVRRMRLEEFIVGNRRTALRPCEMVTAIHIPEQSGHSAFLKLGARRYLVISIAMIAGVVACNQDGVVMAARFAVGACGPVAVRLTALEAAIVGAPPDPARVKPEHFAQLQPIDDIRASAVYRRHAAYVLAHDMIEQLARNLPQETVHG